MKKIAPILILTFVTLACEKEGALYEEQENNLDDDMPHGSEMGEFEREQDSDFSQDDAELQDKLRKIEMVTKNRDTPSPDTPEAPSEGIEYIEIKKDDDNRGGEGKLNPDNEDNSAETKTEPNEQSTIDVNLEDEDGSIKLEAKSRDEGTVIVPIDNMSLWLKPIKENLNLKDNGIKQITSKFDFYKLAAQNCKSCRPEFEDSDTYPAMKFDGIDDYLKIKSQESINLDKFHTEKIIAIAFRTSENIDKRQVLYEQGGKHKGLNFFLDSGSVHFFLYNNSGGKKAKSWSSENLSFPVLPDTSYVVLGRFNVDQSLAELYVNGVLISSSKDIKKIGKHSGGIGLGGVNGYTHFPDGVSESGDTYPFAGKIYELLIYHKDFDLPEVANIQTYLLTQIEK